MPIDQRTAVSLTSDEAKELVARNAPIHLLSLTTLSPYAAGVLATSDYGIVLPAIPAITLATAKALASHKWGLHLPGLTSVSRDVGDALAEHRGPLEIGKRLRQLDSPMLASRIAKESSEELRLDCLESLSPEIARALAYYRDSTEIFPHVSLNGLRHMSAEVAAELVSSFWSVTLEGLSNGRCILGDGADVVLAEDDDYLKRLFVGDNIAGFISQNYSASLLKKVIWSCNYTDEHGFPYLNCLDLDSLTHLSIDQAQALTEFDGRVIRLCGLQDIPNDIASVLLSWLDEDRFIRINPQRLSDPMLARILVHSCSDFDDPAEFFSTCAIKEISVEAADSLIQAGLPLSFPEMRSITPELAQTLAKSPRELSLDGLREISTEVAALLAEHRDVLTLDWLDNITPEVARALAKHRGTGLSLLGLTSFTPEVATALSQYPGELTLHAMAYPLLAAALESHPTKDTP